MMKTLQTATETAKKTTESEPVLTIKMEFGPWGYHATPWGHYVNEGIPEFPPSPYRLMRALVDVWKRDRPEWNEKRVVPILSALSRSPPLFSLPPYSEYSVPLYQDTNSGDPQQGALIYDSFVIMDKGEAVYLKWTDVSLTPSQLSDLSELLSLIGYLGRTESWVDISVMKENPNVEWNCVPSSSGKKTAIVTVPASMQSGDKQWFDTLTQTTKHAFMQGINTPRGISLVPYSLPLSPFSRQVIDEPDGTGVSAVLYSLKSQELPPLTLTLAIADRVHIKLMGIYRRLFGNDIPPSLSGRDTDGTVWLGPGPLNIWPFDSDNDGRLDSMLITSDLEFTAHILKTLNTLTKVWQTEEMDLHFDVVGQGYMDSLMQQTSSTAFISDTPFIPKRHFKKNMGMIENWLFEEVKRECEKLGFPGPQSISLLEEIKKGNTSYRWDGYVRNRKGGPPLPSYLMHLTFSSPVRLDMFAIGYDSHFGSGLFRKSDT